MTKHDRSTGVEILLARMRARPDEFQVWGFISEKNCKWEIFLTALLAEVERRKSRVDGFIPANIQLHFLPQEDVDELYDQLCIIQEKSFSEQIISTVMALDAWGETGGTSQPQ